MTTYDQIGVIYPWEGGECPIDGSALVKVTFSGGSFDPIHSASYWDWQHHESPWDIIAFEMVEFAK